MFIVWGTKIVRDKLGLVAEYCPICRLPQPCKLVRVRAVSHVYFISLGKGKVSGHEITCQHCRTVMRADVPRYTGTVPRLSVSIDNLIDRTNPGLREQIAEMLDREDRALSGQLTPQERLDMLAQPFLALEMRAKPRVSQIHVSWRSAVALVVMIFAAAAGIVPIAGVTGPQTSISSATALAVGLSIAATALIYFIYDCATDTSRYVRRKLQPALVAALAPYNPTMDEIDAVVKELRAHRLVIGRKIKPHALYEAIRVAREAV